MRASSDVFGLTGLCLLRRVSCVSARAAVTWNFVTPGRSPKLHPPLSSLTGALPRRQLRPRQAGRRRCRRRRLARATWPLGPSRQTSPSDGHRLLALTFNSSPVPQRLPSTAPAPKGLGLRSPPHFLGSGRGVRDPPTRVELRRSETGRHALRCGWVGENDGRCWGCRHHQTLVDLSTWKSGGDFTGLPWTPAPGAWPLGGSVRVGFPPLGWILNPERSALSSWAELGICPSVRALPLRPGRIPSPGPALLARAACTGCSARRLAAGRAWVGRDPRGSRRCALAGGDLVEGVRCGPTLVT
jgi:hypothetical protein